VQQPAISRDTDTARSVAVAVAAITNCSQRGIGTTHGSIANPRGRPTADGLNCKEEYSSGMPLILPLTAMNCTCG
jgi:hypothetical protein